MAVKVSDYYIAKRLRESNATPAPDPVIPASTEPDVQSQLILLLLAQVKDLTEKLTTRAPTTVTINRDKAGLMVSLSITQNQE